MKRIFVLFFIIGASIFCYNRPVNDMHDPPGVTSQHLTASDQAISTTDRFTYDFAKSSAAIHNYLPRRWEMYQLAILENEHQKRYEHWAYIRPHETHSDYT